MSIMQIIVSSVAMHKVQLPIPNLHVAWIPTKITRFCARKSVNVTAQDILLNCD